MRALIIVGSFIMFLSTAVMAGGNDADQGPVESLDSVSQEPVATKKTAGSVVSKKLNLVSKESDAEEVMSETVVSYADVKAKLAAIKEKQTMANKAEDKEDAVEEVVSKNEAPEIIKDTPLEAVHDTCDKWTDGNRTMTYTCMTILSIFAIL